MGLNSAGVYKDNIKLREFNYQERSIVFIPMHHLGTESFYNNVKNKTDSLKNENYYFLYEKVNIDRKNDTLMRKFRKIFGVPLTRLNSGYKKLLDSLYPNVKYKKSLIDQPSYEKFGLDSQNSKNVDANSKEIIDYYEKKYGEITLTDCDYKTSVYEKYTKCKEENKIPKKQSEDAVINFRNHIVVENIKESPHQKIAVIYGEGHIEGILKKLSESEKNTIR